jgi:Na+/melibiose symporter-like transporter
MESSMLKERDEEKTRRAFHPKCKIKRRKVSSLPSLHFFLFYGFFFLCVCVCVCVCVCFFFYLRRRRYQEKALETKRQKQEPKMRRLSGSLKVSSLPFLHFFLLYGYFFSIFFSSTWEEENAIVFFFQFFVYDWSKEGDYVNVSLFFFFYFFVANKATTTSLLSSQIFPLLPTSSPPNLFLCYCCNEKGDGNKLSSPSSLCLKIIRRWH